MNYISLYRKWRPQNFDEILGQEAIIRTLKNAIKLNRLSHAYLFSGPRGTGKTSAARILAKALNCKSGPTQDPCGKCDLCTKIRDGHCVDVIEIDAASNRGIDEIRELREGVRFAPVEGKYKVYIIDEVHMLTQEAFNALLKTLEEPPQHVVFILATTESAKVPVTILSRCQKLDFGRINLKMITDHLSEIVKSEKFKIDEKALNLIARSSEGSMRDAVSLLDQLMSFCDKQITFDDVVSVLGTADEELLFQFGEAISNKDIAKGFQLTSKAVEEGRAIPQVTKDLIGHFRNILLLKVGSEDTIDLTKDHLERLRSQAQLFSIEAIKEIIRILSKAETDMKWHPHTRLIFEVAVMEAMENGEQQQMADSKLQIANGKEQMVNSEEKVEIKKEEILKKPVENTASGDSTDGNGQKPQAHHSISKIKNSWNDILSKVKSKSPFSFVSLHEGEPIEINDKGKLIIKFRKGYSFHKERLEEAKNQSIVEEAIKEIIGEAIRIEGVVSDVEPEKTPEKGLSIDKISDLFGGKVVK